MTAAEKHIRHYNHLNGKAITKKQLVKIHTALKNDLEKKRIDTHGPLGIECIKIAERMENAIEKLNGTPKRITLTVVDIEKILRAQKAIKPIKALGTTKIFEKAVAQVPTEVKMQVDKQISKSAMVGIKRKIDLSDGPYKDFVKLYEDTQIMYYGMPGSGKSWDLLTFLKYLADKGYNVVYVAAEEYGRSTFDEKIQGIFKQPSLKEFRYKNYTIVKTIGEIKNIDTVDVILFDSVDKLKWSVDDWTAFSDRHQNMIKIAVKQTTKEGDFKGGQEWSHEMDIVVEIRNRKRIFHKNRLDPDFGKKRDALLMEDRIRTRTINQSINQKVKQRIAPALGKPLATFKPETIV